MRYLIGADPELFVYDQTTKEVVSAHDLIPGTKAIPHTVPGGAVQVDGTSAEFNIYPAERLEDFTGNIYRVYNELLRMIRTKSSSYELLNTPTAHFNPTYFRKLPQHAKLLGCEPDYNAYTLIPNNPPKTRRPFRTGSGHVHIGWNKGLEPLDEIHFMECTEVTKQLDVLLYIPSLLWDKDVERRSLYGKIGAFRPKPYGVEYRCLSNAWVLEEPLHRFVFEASKKAIQLYHNQAYLFDHPKFADRLDLLNVGRQLDDEEILDHYYELRAEDFVPELPKQIVTVD